jgi:hypothetical protein
MDENINWFILLLVNFKCSRSSNVETTSVGVEKSGRGQQIVACCSLLSQYRERERERDREREIENTNAGCCGGAIKQLSGKDNVL